MDYKEYEREVIKNLQEKIGSSYKVRSGTAEMSDSIGKDALLIGKPDVNASLIVRLGEYCESGSLTEETAAAAADRIAKACDGLLAEEDITISDFTEWEAVRPHIHAKLVNTERNQERLGMIPHREILDLSMVYYVRMDGVFQDRQAFIPIWNTHLQRWGADETMLYRTAMENMKELDETSFESMGELLGRFLEAGEEGMDFRQDCFMFVLGNRARRNGAVQICSREVMARIAEFFQGDFWILPSSVHEVILLPAGGFGEDAAGLAEVVKEVNDTLLMPEDILSYHVYRYCRLSGQITIAEQGGAQGEARHIW